MDKRSIYAILALVLALGAFFQCSRMDGFLKLNPMRNVTGLSRELLDGGSLDGYNLRDHYLILYDPLDVASVLSRHNLEKMLSEQKKAFDIASIYDGTLQIKQDLKGVLVASGHLAHMASLPQIAAYAESGGTVALLECIDRAKDETIPQETLERLGILSLGGSKDVSGIRLLTDFYIGGEGFSFPGGIAYRTTGTEVVLSDQAKLHMTSAKGELPLLWEMPSGKGRYLVYNGSVRDDKTNVGLMAAVISHCGEDTIYPIVGCKVFYIDDFPSPVPEGYFDKIYDELHLSTADFYRTVWWPFMRDCAKEYQLKYTGLIIESYGNQVKGPFRPAGGRAARDNLIVYGRELLDIGGELGIHGYNHQPLAPAGYNQENLDYVPWASKEDMKEALQELHRYITSAYPGYQFRCYVPPSDILSPEGKEVLLEVFPDLKVFSSLIDGPYTSRAYYQDYRRNADGTYELPRVTSGYAPSGNEMWAELCVVNYIGIFSHFVHPDEIFYEESKDKSWAMMEEGFRAFMAEVNRRFGWLRPVTDWECAAYFDDYVDMDYRVLRGKDALELQCRRFRNPIRFILRTSKEIDQTEGCTVQPVGASTYLVEVSETESRIHWKKPALP